MNATLGYGIHAGGTTEQARIGNCGNVIFYADMNLTLPGEAVQDVNARGVNDAIVLGTNIQGVRNPGINLIAGFAVGFSETVPERPGHPNGGNPRIPRQPRDADHPNGANPQVPLDR
jgi:hypothetical protein